MHLLSLLMSFAILAYHTDRTSSTEARTNESTMSVIHSSGMDDASPLTERRVAFMPSFLAWIYQLSPVA